MELTAITEGSIFVSVSVYIVVIHRWILYDEWQLA